MRELESKALELLEQFESRHAETLSDVYWITQDESDIQGDYCENCIEKAVKAARKERREEKKRILEKYSDPERIGQFGHEACEKAKKRDLKELGSPNFDYTSSCGGYEAETFTSCELCHRALDVCILPNEQIIQYSIEDFEDGKITAQIGYEAYWLIYNCWGKDDDRHKEEYELTQQLIKKVIELLTPDNHGIH